MLNKKPELIEYCAYNVDEATRQQLQQCLGQECGVKVVEECCLGHCCECFEGPYLIIDGALVRGVSHKVMLEEILATEAHRRTQKEEEKRRGGEEESNEPGA